MTRFFKKIGITTMIPWTPNVDMTHVSISDRDKNVGSPKKGDWIAFKGSDVYEETIDRWLVEETTHAETYQEIDKENIGNE